MRSFSNVALGVAQLASLYSQHVAAGHSEYCLDFPLSCTNNTVVSNICCFNYPGGELLQTQFWDTDPATGPASHWTVHGLWYARLPFSHAQSANNPQARPLRRHILTILRRIAPIRQQLRDPEILQRQLFTVEHGDLLERRRRQIRIFLGTRVGEAWELYLDFRSELLCRLYTARRGGGFLPKKTIGPFKTLDTYAFLAIAGIVPSTTKNYTSAQTEHALDAFRKGVNASIQCNVI